MKSIYSLLKNRFLLRGLGILVVYFLVLYSPFMSSINVILTENTADFASWLINVFFDGESTVRELDSSYKWLISGPKSRGVAIAHPCNAYELYVLYIGFIFSITDVKVQRKLQFILFGTLSIYLLNAFRVIALYVISGQWPEIFNLMHKYIFQGLAYLLIFGFWYFLLHKNDRREA